jgi:predicted TIM-barrel fold metal-dependent hydrolase
MSRHDEDKIALEEHFFLPSFEAYGADGSACDGAAKAHNYDPKYFASVQKGLGDIKLWLEEMDRCGIERMVLSLTQPGIQGIPDRAIAVDTAKRMNDDLAAIVAAHQSRFAGFAAVALQDVRARLGPRFQGRVNQWLFEHWRRGHRPIPRHGFWCGNGRSYSSADLEWIVRPLSPTEDHSRPPG